MPPLPRPVSPLLLRAFAIIARRRIRAAFRAVRMQHAERLRGAPAGPLVVYLNHPSWWDPLVCLTISRVLLPGRRHYAPISAASLREYRFFSRLGMFPVEQKSARGAAEFLRGSQAVLDSGSTLWVTGEGHFTDPRVRPTVLKQGLGVLLQRTASATVIPIALEYTFWNQRLPEVLLSVGEPMQVLRKRQRSSAEWTVLLQDRLQAAQDELATLSLARNPAAFVTLLDGARGTAGVYGTWQRLRSRLRGEVAPLDHALDPALDSALDSTAQEVR